MVAFLVHAVVISSHLSLVIVMFAFVSFRVGSLHRLCCLFVLLFLWRKEVDVIDWCCCFVSMRCFFRSREEFAVIGVAVV